jgi:hypothetical protein
MEDAEGEMRHQLKANGADAEKYQWKGQKAMESKLSGEDKAIPMEICS